MTPKEIMNKLEIILDDAKAGILSTVDLQGTPRMRWMTPAILKDRPGFLYTVSSPDSGKITEILTNPKCEWIIQSPGLTEIVNLKGSITAIDNPALKNEVFELLGSRLTAFWKANPDKDEFIVLETAIEQAAYFKPMKGQRQVISFK